MSNSRELVQDYIEQIWNWVDFTSFNALTLPSFQYYLGGQPARGSTEMEKFVQATRIAFPDWRVQIVDSLVSDDRVAVRWQGNVTHQGVFNGIPPTGRRIAVSGINIYQIKDGRIAAEWEQTDSLGMLMHLGVLHPR